MERETTCSPPRVARAGMYMKGCKRSLQTRGFSVSSPLRLLLSIDLRSCFTACDIMLICGLTRYWAPGHFKCVCLPGREVFPVVEYQRSRLLSHWPKHWSASTEARRSTAIGTLE